MADYFELTKRSTPTPGSGAFMTAAVIICDLCSELIDGMGGPGNGCICERCAVQLKAGLLRGAVIWDKQTEPQLTPAERDFLEQVARGKVEPVVYREDDKARQRMRRAGYAEVVMKPRRWVLTDAGRKLLGQVRRNG